MRRIKLVVSYDGTAYCGWQLQPNGVTIEEVLNQALSSLLKEDIQVIGASRTDSGVHAMRSTSACRTMCGSRRRRRCRLPFIHARQTA